MAGSGKHPGKEALKNKAMLVVRNVTKQEVTNVIFPNGLTVGTVDLDNGAKVHGNMQVAGVLNARDLRINGNPITGTEGPPGDGGRFLFMTLTSPFFSFPDSSSTIANPESITIAVLQASQSLTLPGTAIQISGSDGTNLTGSLSGDFLDEFSAGNSYRSVNLTYADSSMRNIFPLTASVVHEGIRQTRHIHKFIPSSTPSIYFSPSTVTFPADYNGNIDSANLSLGDTAISVLAGPGFLPVDNSSPFSDNTFRVGTPTATGITLGSEGQTDGTDTVTYTTHTSMTGDTATITYPVTVNINGSESTIDIEQDFIKAKSPAPTPIANLSNTVISIEADYLGRDPSDSSYWSASDLLTRFDLATTGSVTAGTTDIVWDGSTVSSPPTNPDEGKFRLNVLDVAGLTDQGTLIQYTGNSGYSGEGDKDARFYYGTASGRYHVALEIKNSDASDTNSDPTIKLYQLGEWDDPTSAFTGGSTRFTTILLNIPFLVTIGGETVTLNRQMIINKNKQPVPDPVAHLTNDVINIPTDYLGRNPDDNLYFNTGTDFPDYAKSVLTVSAGSDDLTWYGDENSATPSDPPEGNFLIDWRSVTGTTENGTVLTYKSAGSLDVAGQDKDYFIYIGNSSSGYVTWLRITEDSSGNPDIDMSKLTEFDDNGLNNYTNGSQRFNVIALTIPIKVTIGGTTETIEKNLTIVKDRQAAPAPVVSVSSPLITIAANHNGANPSNNAGFSQDTSKSTLISVIAGTDTLTYQGDVSGSIGGSHPDPDEGNFSLHWHGASASAVTDNGVSLYLGDDANWSASPTFDTTKELRWYVSPADAGRIIDLDTTLSGDDAKIHLDNLGIHDDSTGSSFTNGTTIFRSVTFVVPVIANVGGTIYNRLAAFTYQKNLSAAASPVVTIEPASVILDANSAGTVSSYSPGQATIEVYKGGTQLTVDNTSTYDNDTFRVGTPVVSNITAGTVTQVDGATSATTASPSAMTADTATITFPVTVKIDGEETTFDKIQTFGKAKDGADGTTPTVTFQETIDISYDFDSNNLNGGSFSTFPIQVIGADTTAASLGDVLGFKKTGLIQSKGAYFGELSGVTAGSSYGFTDGPTFGSSLSTAEFKNGSIWMHPQSSGITVKRFLGTASTDPGDQVTGEGTGARFRVVLYTLDNKISAPPSNFVAIETCNTAALWSDLRTDDEPLDTGSLTQAVAANRYLTFGIEFLTNPPPSSGILRIQGVITYEI